MTGSPLRLGRLWQGAVTLGLVVTLGGCAFAPRAWDDSPPARAAGVEALEVRLPGGYMLDQGPWAVFHVSRPAYVAIFDIHPGVGVTAIYPNDSGASHQRRFGPGIQTVFRSTGFGSRGFTRGFTSRGFGGSSWRGAGPGTCFSRLHSPVVWRLVVASERPLRLERLHSHVAFRLRPAFGSRHFAGGPVRATMDDILRLILPPEATDASSGTGVRWAADYQPYWIEGFRCATPSRYALGLVPPRTGTRFPPWVGTPQAPPDTADSDGPANGQPDGEAEGDDAGSRIAAWRPEERTEGEPLRDGEAHQDQDEDSLLPAWANPGSFDELRIRAGRRAADARRGTAARDGGPASPWREGMTGTLPPRGDRVGEPVPPRRDGIRRGATGWRNGPDRARPGSGPTQWRSLIPQRRLPGAERPSASPSRRPAVRSAPPRSTRPPAVRRPAPRSSESGTRKKPE